MPEEKLESAQERIKKRQRFNILALDGGGVEGVIEAVVLERLMKEFPKLLRDVDLIVGSSTGGIQALNLASGKTAPENLESYQDIAKIVFADCFLDDFRDLRKLDGANYSAKNMRRILQLQFGDMVLRDLDKKVAITSFYLDSGSESFCRGWKLKVFHNFDNGDSDGDVRIVDVGLRTSATPIYFPTADGYIDGGVVANNPSMIGITQALDSRGPTVPFESINLLSLGVGFNGHWIKGKNHDWGAFRWAPHLLFMMLEGSVNMVHFQCSQLLGDRYFRINPNLPEKFPLDAWKKIPNLIEAAENIDLERGLEWLEEYWK